MIFPTYFNSKKSLILYGLSEKLLFLRNLYIKKKLPKTLMLSGLKGTGKATLVNHLMHSIFDENNYDLKNCKLSNKSEFYNQCIGDISANIIYLSGSDEKNIKIDDIRKLKKKILQTSITNKSRFIIFDDIELFNNNSLNALLKIIEEPSEKNYFILINNNSRSLLETIKSRCLEIKIILDNTKRINVIESLIKYFNLNLKIEPNILHLTPGNFIKFNYICDENKMSLENNFLKNLSLILNLYKKKKMWFLLI